MPKIEEQTKAYRTVIDAVAPNPVTIRTLDVGGDKPLPYLPCDAEENPFLGNRGIRLCLQNRAVFEEQLEAILTAAAEKSVKIMLPMVTSIHEIEETRRMIEEIKQKLDAAGTAYCREAQLGIMIETPASAIMARQFAKHCDFFSIGTNDLTGYTMACDRGNDDVAYLYSPLQPSVLRGIKYIIDCANKNNISVGMCGEAAANPMMVPLLMSFGLTEFSVSAPSVLKVRKTISAWSKAEADKVAEKVLAMTTEKEISDYLKTLL